MTTTSDAGPSAATPSTPTGRTLPWWAFGLANVAVVAVLSVLSWWLLVDPAWSPLSSYPQPYTAMLFWTIIAAVWVAFTFGWTGPVRLPQPARGLVGIALTIVIGVGITLLLGYVWGAIDPTFAASRAKGAGFTTGNLVVLFAFFFYVMAAVNWNQWPWAPRAEQPLRGLGELALMAIPTVALYALLVLPNQAVWAVPGTALFSIPTLIGWFYCVIVAVVVTGVLIENWPWRLAGSNARVALFATVGNVVLGTGLYYLLLGLARLLMGPANAAPLGAGVTVYAAELGVCWVFWMIAWSNVFGNRPTHRGDAVNFAVRLVVTLALGVLTFLLYYFVLAGAVLHEPAVAGGMHGEALGFVDWAVLWTLWYVLFLGSYGLPAPHAEDADPAARPAASEAVAP